MTPPMNLENIDVFVEVVTTQSFSRAAKKLNMPTSTVSAKIARLESRLGTTLIKRTTRQLKVTAEGERYYQHCLQALAQIAMAEQELRQENTQISGKLRISLPADMANSLIAPLIRQYLQTYPDVSVDLLVTNRYVDLVAENVDLAIRIGPLADSSLIARRYRDIKAGLWASRDYLDKAGMPNHPKALAQHRLITLSQMNDTFVLYDSDGTPIDILGEKRLNTDDVLSCQVLIASGIGIGILPDFVGQDSNAGLTPVLPHLTSKPISAYLVYPSQRFMPKKLQAFIEMALD